MVKGKKTEGYEEAVRIVWIALSSKYQSICEALVEKVPTIEPQSIEEVVLSLLENSKIRLELKKAGEDYADLKFIKANVGEKTDNIIPSLRCY